MFALVVCLVYVRKYSLLHLFGHGIVVLDNYNYREAC